jgi:hypothetical protein
MVVEADIPWLNCRRKEKTFSVEYCTAAVTESQERASFEWRLNYTGQFGKAPAETVASTVKCYKLQVFRTVVGHIVISFWVHACRGKQFGRFGETYCVHLQGEWVGFIACWSDTEEEGMTVLWERNFPQLGALLTSLSSFAVSATSTLKYNGLNSSSMFR